MIDEDSKSGGASNGHYVTYLYADGLQLTFEITSYRAVNNATLILRLSAEAIDITITDSTYVVEVNGVQVSYDNISFVNVPSIAAPNMYPFTDYNLGNISLVEGVNTICLLTNNSDPMVGTMYATAPMVDCIKITTTAVLTWDPLLDNIG
jgi:hypothetical protein